MRLQCTSSPRRQLVYARRSLLPRLPPPVRELTSYLRRVLSTVLAQNSKHSTCTKLQAQYLQRVSITELKTRERHLTQTPFRRHILLAEKQRQHLSKHCRGVYSSPVESLRTKMVSSYWYDSGLDPSVRLIIILIALVIKLICICSCVVMLTRRCRRQQEMILVPSVHNPNVSRLRSAFARVDIAR